MKLCVFLCLFKTAVHQFVIALAIRLLFTCCQLNHLLGLIKPSGLFHQPWPLAVLVGVLEGGLLSQPKPAEIYVPLIFARWNAFLTGAGSVLRLMQITNKYIVILQFCRNDWF